MLGETHGTPVNVPLGYSLVCGETQRGDVRSKVGREGVLGWVVGGGLGKGVTFRRKDGLRWGS